MKTSSGWPATAPSTSVPANVVLNALTTFAPSGAAAAISCAAEPASSAKGSKFEKSTGFVMSTMTASPMVSVLGDDEHRGARRVAGQQAGVALLDGRADRPKARAHGGELARVRDDERPMAQAHRVGRHGRHAAAAPDVDPDVVVVAAGGHEDRGAE